MNMSSEQDPRDLRSVRYTLTLHGISCLQHLVLWSDLSKVSLDKMTNSGNCLKLRALTSGMLLVVWSKQSRITQFTSPRATRSSWRSWKRAGWNLYRWLIHTFFFFSFLWAVSLTCLFIFGSRFRSSDHRGDCCISNGADREMMDTELCILWLRRSHGRQRQDYRFLPRVSSEGSINPCHPWTLPPQ